MRTVHIFACLLITLTLLPTTITILKNNELNTENFPYVDFVFYRIGAIGMSSIGIFLRFSTIGIFIERSLATCFFESYEHKSSFKWVGFWISLLALLCSGLMGTAYQAGLYPFNFHVGAVVFVDFACFVVSYFVKIYVNIIMINMRFTLTKNNSRILKVFILLQKRNWAY